METLWKGPPYFNFLSRRSLVPTVHRLHPSWVGRAGGGCQAWVGRVQPRVSWEPEHRWGTPACHWSPHPWPSPDHRQGHPRVRALPQERSQLVRQTSPALQEGGIKSWSETNHPRNRGEPGKLRPPLGRRGTPGCERSLWPCFPLHCSPGGNGVPTAETL